MHTNYTNEKISTLTGVLIILAAAVVLFGGVFGWQYYTNPNFKIVNPSQIQNSKSETTDSSSKTSATEDWKTYTNIEYGYEIQYPSGWQALILEVKNPKTDSKIFISLVGTGSPVNVRENDIIYLNGVKGYKMYFDDAPKYSYKIVRLEKPGGGEYEIEVYSNAVIDNETLDKIVSTFKFIK